MRIGIVGASSQVGSSLALYFKRFTTIEVVCFIRSAYSVVFFELFDIKYVTLDVTNDAELKNSFAELDAVIDCSFPAGQLHSILPAIKQNLQSLIGAMPERATFIYMSSIMAYGMPDDEKYVQHYTIPRSSYAYIKRKTEQEVVRLCKKQNKKGYNLRLGQVHGFLQSVNSSFREKLSATSVASINGSPQDLTNTIFIYSVCEAVVKCAKGELKPGLFTLVAQPQWTLTQLYTYYKEKYHLDCRLAFFDEKQPPTKGWSFLPTVLTAVKKYRPLLETYILMRSPKMSVELKGQYRQSEAYRSVNQPKTRKAIDVNLLGTPPFDIISDIKSSVSEVIAHETEIEAFYNTVITSNRK